MHELDITKNLIKQIKKAAKENEIQKDAIVTVELGKLSTFSRKPIEFYFDELIKADKFFKSKKFKLKIEEKQGELECLDCKSISKINELFDTICTKCFSINTKIISGKDVIIKKIEF